MDCAGYGERGAMRIRGDMRWEMGVWVVRGMGLKKK